MGHFSMQGARVVKKNIIFGRFKQKKKNFFSFPFFCWFSVRSSSVSGVAHRKGIKNEFNPNKHVCRAAPKNNV